jgi:glyoxylase-like metal-dependent hydrolase (beta-lactamase superfamily II)
MSPQVKAFFDEPTFTVSYVVSDPTTRACAVIDSVLDYDPASGRTSRGSADAVVAYVRDHDLTVEWILETHVHADHLSAAPLLRRELGGKTGIGRDVTRVQGVFSELFNAEQGFRCDGTQFDQLFDDGDVFSIGGLKARVLHTPGHTPACVTYLIGDAAFVGDTLFMPDFGTARTDFPGGDAGTLYDSIHRILALPPDTRLFMCHDYKAPGRSEYRWETTVREERERNIHVHDGVSREDFVQMRESRDRELDMPRLLLPSVQVNMRGGDLPPAEDNGVRYLKIPLDAI